MKAAISALALLICVSGASAQTCTAGCPEQEESYERAEQNARELARVDALLASDPNAFNGFSKSSGLAEIRAEIDRLRRLRMEREMLAAESDAQRVKIAERHSAYWKRVEANRAERANAPLAVNIAHGLMMIYRNKKKAGL